jgi:predicted nuclease with TOPRIM domain
VSNKNEETSSEEYKDYAADLGDLRGERTELFEALFTLDTKVDEAKEKLMKLESSRQDLQGVIDLINQEILFTIHKRQDRFD